MANDLSMYREASTKIPRVADDIDIGPDLTRHMSRQPGLFAYYGGIAEAAYQRSKRLKYEIHCLQEDLDGELRRKAKAKGEKLPTETAIKAKINRHPDVRAKFEEYLEAKRVAGMLAILKDAFKQRADMLRSIGAMQRSELDQSDIATLKRKAKHVSKSLRSGSRGDDDAE